MKHFCPGVFLALVALIGCQQPPLEPESIEDQAIPIVNGALFFQSVEDYDAFLNKSVEEREEFFEAHGKQGFVSYADAHLREGLALAEERGDDPLMHDHVFSRMLNEEGVIKIGPWYCRVNAPEEKVFVLHEDHFQGHYADLINQNTEFAHLLVFSTDTEVLEELALMDGNASMAGRGELLCDGAPGNSVSDNNEVDGTSLVRTHETWLRYLRYGIGFTIEHQVKWQYRTNNLLVKWLPIEAWNVYTVYQREYEVKCGDGPGQEWNEIPLLTNRVTAKKSSYHYDIYRGSKKLSGYRVRVQTYFRVPRWKDDTDFVDESTRSLYIQYQ